MVGFRHFTAWLLVWSFAFFATRGRIASPFALNLGALVAVVLLQAGTNRDAGLFLFAVAGHLLPVALTLPPRFTSYDATVSSVVFLAYIACLSLLGDNPIAVYERLRQVAVELDTLTFARVTAPVRGVVSDDDGEDAAVTHFYGFALTLDRRSTIWFKLASAVPRCFVGPAQLHSTPIRRRRDLPRPGDLLVGRAGHSPKGAVFEWWCPGGAPLLALKQACARGRVPPTMPYGTFEQGGPAPDDFWALARFLCGDTALLVDQLRPPAERPRHPVHKDAHSFRRGIRTTFGPCEFVFFAAELARDRTVLQRFVTYAAAKGVPLPAEMRSVEVLDRALGAT